MLSHSSNSIHQISVRQTDLLSIWALVTSVMVLFFTYIFMFMHGRRLDYSSTEFALFRDQKTEQFITYCLVDTVTCVLRASWVLYALCTIFMLSESHDPTLLCAHRNFYNVWKHMDPLKNTKGSILWTQLATLLRSLHGFFSHQCWGSMI